MKPLHEAVADALANDGPLSRELEDFEARPGQRSMATAVSETFRDGGILLAEAGTGTGKTLAYLVPAVLNGRRVLVSTGTKNLQEQIVQKDVPLLQQALDRPFTATCMKGRGNYLCLHRFELARLAAGPRTAEDRRHLALIESWLPGTDTGDRAEIDDIPDDLPLWADVAATTENCLGSGCPRYSDCFVTRMRQRAAESDLVIVNHHLLCADAAVRHHSFGEVIPECSLAVVDEAHQLEDVATQYLGIVASNHRVEALVRDGGRALARGPAAQRAQVDAMRRALARLEHLARAFFSELQQQRLGTESSMTPSAGLFDERRRVTAESLSGMADTGLALIGALDEVEACGGLMTDAAEDIRAIGARAADLRATFRFLLQASDAAYVYFVEIRGRGVFLRALPIDVSSIVRELLFDRMHATVLTSATLAVNGQFEYK